MNRRINKDDVADDLRYQSEERFRLLVESVKEYAIFMLDGDGCVASWNAGAERITGYTASEVIGVHFTRFYADEARETRWPEHQLEVATRDGRFEEETWRLRKGGDRFWAHSTLTALRDQSGTLRGFASVIHDRSERRRQQDLVAQNEERLRALLNGVRDRAIYMLDPNGVVVSWGEGAERIEGHRAEEMLGAHFSQMYPAEAIERGYPEHELCMAATEGYFEDEGWRVRKDGSRFWANVVITALRDRHSKLIGFCTIMRDLTEQRRSEQARRQSEACFRQLIESVHDHAIYLLDCSGQVVSWNAGAERITGFESAEILGQHFSRCYSSEQTRAGVPGQQLEAARLHGRLEAEGVRVRKDGTAYSARVVIVPVCDADGRLQGYWHLMHDRSQNQSRPLRALEESSASVATPAPAEPRGAGAATQAAPAPSKRRVLVVDDNVDSVTSLVLLLQTMGHEAQGAYDGVEALEVAQRFGPEAVVLDIGLPRLDGYEVARRLRERSGRRYRLIALTGWDQPEDQERARAAGFDHHLVKPVDVEELGRLLDAGSVSGSTLTH